MKVYVKKIDGLTLPSKGSPVSAGYDMVATSDPKVVGVKYENTENGWQRVDYIEYETNIYMAPSVVTVHSLIHPRSSISKYNLQLANSIGLVDNDYRGMVICRFKYVWQPEDYELRLSFTGSDTAPTGYLMGKVNYDKIYKKGEKIAQLVFESTIGIEWEVVDELEQTQRGTGGFGSTGEWANVPPKTAPEKPVNDPFAELNKPSDLAEKFRKNNYYSPNRPYEQVVREAQRQMFDK